MDLVLRDRHDLFMGDCADSYESAICGFLVGGINGMDKNHDTDVI